MAEELLSDIHNAYVIGDSAYSAKELFDALVARGCSVVIPAKPTHPQRDHDAHIYKERHLGLSLYFPVRVPVRDLPVLALRIENRAQARLRVRESLVFLQA